jgi:hypothetical protein
MNITTAYRQMAQDSYDESIMASRAITEQKIVALEEGKNVTLTVPFPGSNEDKIIAQAEKLGQTHGFTVLGGQYNKFDKTVELELEGDVSKLTKFINGFMHINLTDAEIVKEFSESIDESTAFSRLPGNVIGNELYVVTKDLKAFTDSQTNGNDFDEKAFNKIINALKEIKLKSKRFDSEDDVPVSYQYKK